MSDERGFTLVELLAASLIFLIVMAATLNALDAFSAQTAQTERRNVTQQQARLAVNQIARQLRNLASPTPRQPQAVDKAAPFDLVFQTVDPQGPNSGANKTNVRRMRYCLASGRVYRQSQTWTSATTPAVPNTGACPDADARWTGTTLVAENVVNDTARPAWLYDAVTTADITFVRTTLVVDVQSDGRGETALSTGVFLRNQNRAPTAAFTATAAGNRHVLLNGSISTDPEGEPLVYAWYDGTTQVGTGITLDYVAPATGTRSLGLTVTDPGGLDADAPAQNVVVR